MLRHVLISWVLACAPAFAQAPREHPFATEIDELHQADGAAVKRLSLGVSDEGRPIDILRIAVPSEVDPATRPALLLATGIDGQHEVGVDVALRVARTLLGERPDLLERVTLFVLPGLAVDTLAFHRSGEAPRQDGGATFTPNDADHDGRVDEDGPLDLNGDGVITFMRVANPPAGSGLRRTHVVSEDDPRLMVPAPKDKAATHAVLPEGRDQDGDGRIAEDGRGGTALDRNFPARWPEWQPDAGSTQLSESATRRLVDWMLKRQNLVAVLVYGPHDTLAKLPPVDKKDESGRLPLGILAGDKTVYDELGKLYREITGVKGAVDVDDRGSFHHWAHTHLGLLSLSTPLWVRPDLVKAPAKSKDDTPSPAEEGSEEDESEPPGENEEKPKGEPKKKARKGEASWLDLVDELAAAGVDELAAAGADEQAAAGAEPPFLAWTRYEHPELGTVEIGGFRPGFRVNPPADRVDELAAQQLRFVTELLERLPALRAEVRVAPTADTQVWRLTLRVTNDGKLPSRLAIADLVRRLPPLLARLDVPEERVLAGPAVARLDRLAPAASTETSWLVLGEPGSTVDVRVDSAELGSQRLEITLEPTPLPQAPEDGSDDDTGDDDTGDEDEE